MGWEDGEFTSGCAGFAVSAELLRRAPKGSWKLEWGAAERSGQKGSSENNI